MSRNRYGGIIAGSIGSIEAELVDAIGGGICKKHGKFIGLGRHGLKACPFCDIDEFYQKSEARRAEVWLKGCALIVKSK